MSPTASHLLELEDRVVARNYTALGPPLVRGLGPHVWDCDGVCYIDCLAGFSAVNQGHCHPAIIAAMHAQASRLGLVSRGLHNDVLPHFGELLTSTFGYDKMLPASTGVEAGETACKLARRWGYDVKGILNDKARIIFAAGNFWGRTLAAVSSSTDPSSYGGFGPKMPGFDVIPFDDIPALEAALDNSNVCAFMVEPIQGEAGVVVPQSGYLKAAAELCAKHKVLLIADEVQTGLGRAGSMSHAQWSGVRPDIVCLGKALGGGLYPVSAVLCDAHIMDVIKPGQHGSTWGGNPVASAVGIASLRVLLDEGLCENSRDVGAFMRKELQTVQQRHGPKLTDVRGDGLLTGIVIPPDVVHGLNAWSFCKALLKYGVITKPTHERVVRLAPPLCITKEQASKVAHAVDCALQKFS